MSELKNVKAVCFDCFGTTVQITKHTRPFRQLITRADSSSRESFGRLVMTKRWSLRDAARELDISITEAELQQLEAQLDEEKNSLECFAETVDVLCTLKDKGYKLALCSNLALPYSEPVDDMIGHLFDVKAWSYEVGHVKPDSSIYTYVMMLLNLNPDQILMVGDTEMADYKGARILGMEARHLVREKDPAALAPHQIPDLRALIPLT